MTRKVCLFGALVLGLCILAAAWAQTLWQFYILFFLAGFLGAGSLFAPLIANVGNWFKYGAGLALGIASAGQALGQGGVPFATAVLIGAMGWRDTLTTIGVITLAALIPLAMLIRQPPKHLFGWIGHGIGGYQGGYFFDLSGGYTVTYANASLAGVINLIIVGSLYITIVRRKTALASAGQSRLTA